MTEVSINIGRKYESTIFTIKQCDDGWYVFGYARTNFLDLKVYRSYPGEDGIYPEPDITYGPFNTSERAAARCEYETEIAKAHNEVAEAMLLTNEEIEKKVAFIEYSTQEDRRIYACKERTKIKTRRMKVAERLLLITLAVILGADLFTRPPLTVLVLESAAVVAVIALIATSVLIDV